MLLINTFNLGSTQTGEAFEPPKLKQNRVLEWLPFTSITYSLLNTTPPSTSKLPHFSSWDLAMQSTGSGSWAYETPLHPGSPIPALLSIYPSPLQSAARSPPPAFSSRGLSCKERHANLGFNCYQQIKYKSECVRTLSPSPPFFVSTLHPWCGFKSGITLYPVSVHTDP